MGGIPEAVGMETHLKLLKAGITGAGPTVKGAPGSDCDRRHRSLQMQTTLEATIAYHGAAGVDGRQSPEGIGY